MKFSIITPSFRSGPWLKLCIASVADQGVELEHIVQDAGSDDGTLDWLPRDPRVKAFVEKDAGMYDAINRGLRRATGNVLAYLNCDEQYLPGTLMTVRDFFQAHPDVEVALGDTVFVDSAGRYLCHRRAILPSRYHTWVSGTMSAPSCAIFFRRSILDQRCLLFDSRLQDLADVVWMLELINLRVKMGVVGRFTTAFAITGQNRGQKPTAVRERAELAASAPGWARMARPFVVGAYRVRRFMAGHYAERPFNYSIYTSDTPTTRTVMSVAKPSLRFQMHRPPDT
jgi:glycosyltransferase involved in cell wall biosynthesis